MGDSEETVMSQLAVLREKQKAESYRITRIEQLQSEYVRELRTVNRKLDSVARDVNITAGGAKWLGWGVGIFLTIVSIGVAVLAIIFANLT